MKSPWKIPWLTWVAHLIIAATMTLVIGSLGIQLRPEWLAASYPIFFYTFRELDQLLQKFWNRRAINWLDVALDTLAPIVGAVLIAIWVL